MGLQATSPPTSPLHRPPISTGPMLKRKHDLIEDDEDILMSMTAGSGVKKICVEVVCSNDHHLHHNDSHNISDEDIEEYSDEEATTSSDEESSRSNSALEDSMMITSSSESNASDEENKENHINVNKFNKDSTGGLDSILAKTLQHNSSSSTPSPTSTTTAPSTPSSSLTVMTHSAPVLTSSITSSITKNDNESPKVIVEHKPLPSIYDLHQMSAACDTLDDNSGHGPLENNINTTELKHNSGNDSGVSDDDDDEEDVSDLETGDEDDDDDEPSPSPIFDPVLRGTTAKPHLPSPPKAIYNDRFWNQGSYSSSSAGGGGQQQQHQHPQQPSLTFQFLEQSTQRIECAENGKSYLQLGTMNAHSNHSNHHVPVTPVIQPKPNMVYRRPIPPFRNHNMVSMNSAAGAAASVATPRPVCDHSNCLQKKNSYCYRGQRSRMLNMSLSKLHMARQSHEGSLRRSVLICNMLRYIEEETEREAINETNQYHNTVSPPHNMETDQYWPQTSQHTSSPPTPTPTTTSSQQGSVADSPIYNMAEASRQQTPQPTFSQCGSGARDLEPPYEATLKDFNSAFRSTPYSSPAHPGSDMDSGLGVGDEDRGINWSSVLSLSSGQSELDPLNNNTFATEAWPSVANTPTTLSQVHEKTITDISSSTILSSTTVLSELETTISTTTTPTTSVNANSPFDDIGWKLSADDVLKAFPNDENLFVAGP
jgi:hypothetical protein